MVQTSLRHPTRGGRAGQRAWRKRGCRSDIRCRALILCRQGGRQAQPPQPPLRSCFPSRLGIREALHAAVPWHARHGQIVCSGKSLGHRGAGGIEYGPAPMRVGAGPCKPFLRDGKARLCLLVEARLRLCRVNILPLPDMVCDSSTRQAAWRIIPRSEWSW